MDEKEKEHSNQQVKNTEVAPPPVHRATTVWSSIWQRLPISASCPVQSYPPGQPYPSQPHPPPQQQDWSRSRDAATASHPTSYSYPGKAVGNVFCCMLINYNLTVIPVVVVVTRAWPAYSGVCK